MNLTTLKETINQCLEEQNAQKAIQLIRHHSPGIMPIGRFQRYFNHLLHDAMKYGTDARLFGRPMDQSRVDSDLNHAIELLMDRYGKGNVQILFKSEHIIPRKVLIQQLDRMLHLRCDNDKDNPVAVDWSSVRECLTYAHSSPATYLHYYKLPDQHQVMHSTVDDVSAFDLEDTFRMVRQMNVEAISEHIEH